VSLRKKGDAMSHLDSLPLFAPRPTPEGDRLKAEGIALVEASEPPQWREAAAAAIARLASSGAEFGADDVRAIAGDPQHPNAMGSVFLRAARSGAIQFVRFENSKRPSLHAHPVRIWRGR
jgi:hypothetical protein